MFKPRSGNVRSSAHLLTWRCPVAKVILMTPGEVELAPYCGYLTVQALVAQFAIAIGAAVVLVERESNASVSNIARATH